MNDNARCVPRVSWIFDTSDAKFTWKVLIHFAYSIFFLRRRFVNFSVMFYVSIIFIFMTFPCRDFQIPLLCASFLALLCLHQAKNLIPLEMTTIKRCSRSRNFLRGSDRLNVRFLLFMSSWLPWILIVKGHSERNVEGSSWVYSFLIAFSFPTRQFSGLICIWSTEKAKGRGLLFLIPKSWDEGGSAMMAVDISTKFRDALLRIFCASFAFGKYQAHESSGRWKRQRRKFN